MCLIDFQNFHDSTFADFAPCDVPAREPDFISRSRSAYWDLGDRVVRHSDHWGRVRSCCWLLEGCRTRLGQASGVCRYGEFRRIARLSVEADRAVPVAPFSRPPLAGRRLSFVPAGRRPRREVVLVVAETPFRLTLSDGRVLPRRSLAAAWLVD